MDLVEVGRKQTRKVCNNVRGVTRLGCILSPPLYMQTHCIQLDSDSIQDVGCIANSVFTYKEYVSVPERLNGSACKAVDS